MIVGLGGAVVIGVEGGVGGDLGLGEGDGGGHDEQFEAFGVGGGGEGAVVAVVGFV